MYWPISPYIISSNITMFPTLLYTLTNMFTSIPVNIVLIISHFVPTISLIIMPITILVIISPTIIPFTMYPSWLTISLICISFMPLFTLSHSLITMSPICSAISLNMLTVPTPQLYPITMLMAIIMLITATIAYTSRLNIPSLACTRTSWLLSP